MKILNYIKKKWNEFLKKNEDISLIHPLDDVDEIKVDVDKAGPMYLSKSAKFSLYVLRIYLILMIILAIYKTLIIAGVL